MDDFIGRTDLIAPERLRELTRRSDFRGAVQTLSHLGAIAATGTGPGLAPMLPTETSLMRNPQVRHDTLAVREYRTHAIVPGRARGRLVGGNLTLLAALAGTPYFPDAPGAMIGHVDYKRTVPIGVRAEMDADAVTIELLEPAVL